MFLTDGPAGMPDWTEVLGSAVGPRVGPLHQKLAEAGSQP